MQISPISPNYFQSFKGRVIAEHMAPGKDNGFNFIMQKLSEHYVADDSFEKVIIDKKPGKEIYVYAQEGDTVVARDNELRCTIDERRNKATLHEGTPLTTKQENYGITVYHEDGSSKSSGFYLDLDAKIHNNWFLDFCKTIDSIKNIR